MDTVSQTAQEAPGPFARLIPAAGLAYVLVVFSAAGGLALSTIVLSGLTFFVHNLVSFLSPLFPAFQFIGSILGCALSAFLVAASVCELVSERKYRFLMSPLLVFAASGPASIACLYIRLMTMGGFLEKMPVVDSTWGITVVALTSFGSAAAIAALSLWIARSKSLNIPSLKKLPLLIVTWPWAVKHHSEALMKKRWMKFVAPLIYFHLLAWAVHFATFTSIRTFFAWFEDCNLFLPILNVILIGLSTMFIFALVNRFRLACILVIIPLAVLSFSHWMKVAVRGVVVYPWDLAIMGEGVQVLDFSPLAGWWPNLLLLLILVPFLIMAYGWLPRWRMKIWQRLCAAGVFVLFVASLFYPSWSVLRPFHNQILKGTWNQNIAYSRAGVFLAFAAEVQYFIVREPDGYSEEKVDAILAGLPEKPDTFDGLPDKPVNLILILSESFWDPTQLDGVEFQSDPIPTVHEIEKRFGSIECVAPVYGGGTCDSELEFLTGCSMLFFPPDTAPYKYYIRKPLPSIASVLGGLGYSTVTLAGSYESYFNDYQVYPRLGFDRFINAKEWTIDNITTRGWYIDDDSTMLQIMHTSRRLKKQGRPYLINVNTMENHWPYPHERYAGMDYADRLEMKAPPLDGTPLQILQTFVFGMTRSDAALKKLIEHYEKEQDPVMIIFYGDHLPGLGHGGKKDKVFRQCGFFTHDGDDPESCRLRLTRKYTVKVYFWNNFDYRPKLPKGPISMNFCPVFILRNIGVKPTPFFSFLEKVCGEYPVINPHGCLDRADNFIYSSEARNRGLLRKYDILQWDRVFGEGYSNNR